MKLALIRLMLTRLLITAIGLYSFPSLAAGSKECVGFFEKTEAIFLTTKRSPDTSSIRKAFNEKISANYPSLVSITKDPEAFNNMITQRFEAQKNITPHDPYLFDFSEIALPLLKNMKKNLALKISELVKVRPNASTKLKNEIDVALKYLNELSTETNSHLLKNKISYRRNLELSFFYSRAIGHFDARKQGPYMRFALWLDRVLNGYNHHSIEEEYSMYQNNQFKMFSGKSLVPSYKRAQEEFESMLSDKNTLKGILVPTDAALKRDIFFQLMPHKIYLIGATEVPILADGTLRPGGDFWNHDIRQSSIIYYRTLEYIKTYKLSKKQYDQLHAKMDEWIYELIQRLEGIQDEPLKLAIWLSSFNLHHERGYLMAPSSYMHKNPGFVPRALYAQQKLAGQYEKDMNLKMDEGYEWLRDYWLPKLSEEEAIIGQKPHSNYPGK